MSDAERTEEATPRRREKAREEGQISKSQDLNSALILSVNLWLIFTLAPFISTGFIAAFKQTFENLHPDRIDDSVLSILAPYAKSVGMVLLPFLLLSAISAVFIIRMMVGPLFSMKALQPKWDKLLPSGMLKALKSKFNFFDPKQMVELVKSFIKLIVVGGVGYSVIMSRLQDLLGLLGVPLQASFKTLVGVMSQMIVDMCIAMIFLGIIDKKFQDHEYEKSIKMTKQEIKDEHKNAEGDPKIKQKIKSAQMQFMRQKMMHQVKSADVVVTNPTHYAVAIKYDTSVAPAPQVVAKGVDFMAFKIREIAEENNIPIQENKPLARTLYKVVPLDGLVPPELYVAVAELLAFVYNQGRRT
jgi:flagellar biosynthetic protein FlhB